MNDLTGITGTSCTPPPPRLGMAILMVALLTLSGCRGVRSGGEVTARRKLDQVATVYRPHDVRPVLPELHADSGLSNFLAYALLNQPAVETAYREWQASVERITLERSLPDPLFGFQSDITDIAKMLMFGLSQQLPGPGKLKARAAVAGAVSEARYFAFENAVQQTAFTLKRSFYELFFLDEQIAITRKNRQLLEDLEQIARARNDAGKVTLEDVLRARIARDQVTTDLTNLEDSRHPRMAAFKAALGLASTEPDPPVPSRLESTPLNVDEDQLLEIAFSNNPQLAGLAAQIRAAEAGISLAYKQNVPDFSLGAMADVKSTPVMIRPLLGMTLPLWRDKVAAGIAQAEAERLASGSRLDTARIALTVAVAEKAFAWRQIGRNLALLQDHLIPQAGLSVEVARAGYLAGNISFFNLIEAQRQRLAFELSEVDARTRREIVLAEMGLLIAGIPPEANPLQPLVNTTTKPTTDTHSTP
ncbi:MAG: TolC family protein [Verrucomicrobiales bacterium]|nr:TolC family protein [Verrucomicrobiales bacterium]